jgi:hypothetical protein
MIKKFSCGKILDYIYILRQWHFHALLRYFVFIIWLSLIQWSDLIGKLN